jgi:hypothetical protein
MPTISRILQSPFCREAKSTPRSVWALPHCRYLCQGAEVGLDTAPRMHTGTEADSCSHFALDSQTFADNGENLSSVSFTRKPWKGGHHSVNSPAGRGRVALSSTPLELCTWPVKQGDTSS